MNKVVLIGRLTKEPDIRWSQGPEAKAVARFTLAVDRRYKKEGEPEADFIPCVAFGRVAEIIEKHVTRGTKIAIEGSIRTGSYINKDGHKVYTTDVVVESFDFCERKSDNSFSGQQYQNMPEGASEVPEDGFVPMDNISEDDLPFK